MFCRFRAIVYCFTFGIIATAGCAVPKSRLVACQQYNCDLQRKNQQLCAQYENLRAQNQELANKALDAEDRLVEQEELLAKYENEISEYQRDRDELHSKYAALAEQGGLNPLPRRVREKLADFARNHPEFVEVDPELGISKFQSDLLFPSGEATLSPESQQVLHEFASIFRDPSAQGLNIHVVGHTDTKPIAKERTRQLYGTNWNLSTARANAVVEYLQNQGGINGKRLGVSGFGPYQPADPSNTAGALAKNRRVEIWVLAPDAPIIGRTDGGTRF